MGTEYKVLNVQLERIQFGYPDNSELENPGQNTFISKMFLIGIFTHDWIETVVQPVEFRVPIEIFAGDRNSANDQILIDNFRGPTRIDLNLANNFDKVYEAFRQINNAAATLHFDTSDPIPNQADRTAGQFVRPERITNWTIDIH